jgi:SAM-dependent methyltransferase
MIDPAVDALFTRATDPYRAAGRFAWHFAGAKLRRDPVFVALVRNGVVPDAARLVDLGCGQGLLAAWLTAARAQHATGSWPRGWAPPPAIERYWGLELMSRDVARARLALGGLGEFVQGDIRSAPLGSAGVVVILDVLHYIEPAAQRCVLARVRDALPPGGVLVTRIGDAAGGVPFRISQWVDRGAAFARGHGYCRLHCRPLTEWMGLLRDLGFGVEATPMSGRNPFANVLLVCRRNA